MGLTINSSQYNSGADYETVTGEIVSISNAKPYVRMKQVVADINPAQDLHGYDNPWPAGGGKNKLNDSLRHRASNNVFFGGAVSNDTLSATLPAGTYTYTVKYKSLTLVDLYVRDIQALEFIEGFPKYGPAGSNIVSQTFTLTSTTQLSFWTYNPNITSTDDVEFAIVESGPSFTSYAPYSNLCPISGWSEAKVTRTGKNLLVLSDIYKSGEQNAIYSYTQGGGGVNITATGTYSLLNYEYNNLTVGQTYTLSFYGYGDGDFNRVYINTIGTTSYDKWKVLTGTNTKYTITFTATLSRLFIRFYLTAGSTTGSMTISDFQLELGSPATAYEPYNGNTYTISLGDTRYGAVLDVTRGKLRVTHGILMLDNTIPSGANGFRNITALADGVRAEYYPYRSIGKGNSAAILSDKFVNGDTLTGTPYNIYTGSSDPRLYVCLPSIYTTEAQFRQWFADNPTTVCYELDTPIEVDLTPTEIKTLLGTNNVWSDTNGDVTVKYMVE